MLKRIKYIIAKKRLGFFLKDCCFLIFFMQMVIKQYLANSSKTYENSQNLTDITLMIIKGV